jgi:hypothetical protein
MSNENSRRIVLFGATGVNGAIQALLTATSVGGRA